MKINHIAIWVENLELMSQFYHTYFNFSISPEYHNSKKQFTSRFLSLNENSAKIKHPFKKTTTFSIKDSKADYFAYNIKAIPEVTQYSIDGKSFKLNLIGKFNVSNAMAAIAICNMLGIDKFDAAKALEGFLGTNRRLEVIGDKKGITFIDDFAHNPDKVAGSMSALKDYKGRVITMFQPHGFAPMKLTGKGIIESFAKYMDKEDILIMPDIFFVGGTADKSIYSNDIIDYALSLGINALYIPNKQDVNKYILENDIGISHV